MSDIGWRPGDIYYNQWTLPASSTIDTDATSLYQVDLRRARPAKDSPAERDLLARAFAAYRRTGFPYPMIDDQTLLSDLTLLRNTKTSIEDRSVKQSYVGYATASAFHPAMYAVKCNGRLSPIEAFGNDETLRRCLLRRIRSGDHLKPHSVRREILTAPGCQGASNFRSGRPLQVYWARPNRGSS